MLSFRLVKPSTVSRVVDFQSRWKNKLPLLADQRAKTIPLPWNKVSFTEYCETIKKKYKVNDTVAMSTAIARDDFLPSLFRIQYINELFHDVSWDHGSNEPLLITLVPVFGGIAFTRTGGQIRGLTEKEFELVKLRNTPIKGTA